MTQQYDVVILGAGFAGLVAGRELSARGKSVLIVEARDRIGGRTWTDHRLGHDIELGGTWFHNLQPYVWSEITRYGLQLDTSPEPECFVLATDDGPRAVDLGSALEALTQGLEHLTKDARGFMPRPFTPLHNHDAVEKLDEVTIAERLASLDVGEDGRIITEAFVATGFQAPSDELSLAHAYRITSLSQWDAATELEAASTYKIRGGTRALAQAIADDSSAEVYLETQVTSLRSTETAVEVHTKDGRSFIAGKVIVTVPINVLSTINFDPPLSAGKRKIVDAGQASRGVKVWARVRGTVDPFVGMAAPDTSPLTFAQLEYYVDGDSLIVAFGPDASTVGPDDLPTIQDALRRWLPEAEVIAVDGHDWTNDEFSRETWANLRPGQLAAGIPELQHEENNIFFAGSDYTSAWLGYVDGAVETALVTARKILDQNVEAPVAVAAARV
ncbi:MULTISPECIES: flavin monoamine oxidase family protein [unclassified Rhodococcus (in: high G+C Gram-positive bacteria)]|jgi:monoamine oxidase|uniref:flavin monoamine oxidase family protein n=1 Tax=unclassified Rhodococcus (in: high G+C Gram-positive bacteria) TaxID=192944 RepID=UPI000562591E|nr:NAD(P)/FAD-dependent oxidoreductase [Rhodococcus sp. DK17]